MTDNNNVPETNNSTRTESLIYELDADERPSRAVIQAVAALTDTLVLDLDPLYHVIDPKHLDGMITGQKDGGTIKECSVSFQFNGCLVTVNQNTVRVQIDDN